MNFLLDTNACIAILNDRPPLVREHMTHAIAQNKKLYISAIVGFELWYGVAKSVRQAENRRRVETFLDGPLELLPFDAQDALVAGTVRAQLEARGHPVGAYDLLIAGQALRRQLTVITANTREFSRIDGLKWEDWARQP